LDSNLKREPKNKL